MKQLSALAWKEWHESRTYLWIGLGIFLGLPLIAALEAVFHTKKLFEIDASTWVVGFGGVFAVIVAVSGTCRDVQGRLEDFWRSRPVNVTGWFVVKYVIGLAVVLVCCMVPLAVQVYLNRDKSPAQVLIWYPFLWSAIYSVGFVAGCLIRRTAHAATLGLAGLLMIYLMPVILPPLEWLNTSQVETKYGDSGWQQIWHQTGFAVGMAGIGIIGLAVAIVAVYRDWQIQSGRKMMYGLVASALLLLLASAAFQLGTNLPILQQLELPADEMIQSVRFDGNTGYVLTEKFRKYVRYQYHPEDNLRRTLTMTSGWLQLGAPVEVQEDQRKNLYQRWGVENLSPKFAAYLEDVFPPGIKDGDVDEKTPRAIHLFIFDCTDGTFTTDLKLWEEPNAPRQYLYLHAWKDRLFVVGNRLEVFDISDPKSPRLISDEPFKAPNLIGWDFVYHNLGEIATETHRVMPLFPVPGLPPEECLKMAIKNRGDFDGSTFCLWQRDGLVGYHLTNLTNTAATFDEFAKYTPSFLENTMNTYHGYNWWSGGSKMMADGLLFDTGGYRGSFANASISVFDTRGPKPMQRVGHFAAPDAYAVQPLADGRSIVGGGNKLYLVGPPPRRSE